MQITPCRTYHAKTVDRGILRMPDGHSVFKLYYISNIGRPTPELFEWQHCPRTPKEFEAAFLAGGHQGIGFVTAFPHVTKIFRFSPGAETIVTAARASTPEDWPAAQQGQRTLVARQRGAQSTRRE